MNRIITAPIRLGGNGRSRYIARLCFVFCIVFFGALASTASTRASAQGVPGDLVSLPFARGHKIFTSRKQPEGGVAFCVQNGPNGKPRVLLTSGDAPLIAMVPLSDFSVSDDGRYCAYLIAQPDKRYETGKIIEVDTGRKLDETLLWIHFGDIAWRRDGFYYGGYREPKPNMTDYSDERVLFHRLGTSQQQDQVIYEDPANPKRKYLFLLTFDHRFFLLHILERVGGQLLASEWFRRESKLQGNFTPIQGKMAPGRFFLCDNRGDQLVLYTRYKSPAGRIIEVDTHAPEEAHWRTLLPEPVDDAEPVMGKLLILKKQEGGGNRALIYSLRGRYEGEIPTEAGSMADIQFGRKNEEYVFVSVERGGVKSYFRYDRHTHTLIPFS